MSNYRPLTREMAASILGEGFHTSLRKAGESQWSDAAWSAINQMHSDEWNRILEFLVDGLKEMRIELVTDDPEKPKSIMTIVAEALVERGWTEDNEGWSHPDSSPMRVDIPQAVSIQYLLEIGREGRQQ